MPVYDDGDEYLENTCVIDIATVKKINDKFNGIAKLSRLSNEKLESIYIYKTNESKEVSIYFDDNIGDTIALINPNIAKNFNLDNGDNIRVGGINMSVYILQNEFDYEANLILSKNHLKSLTDSVRESNQLKLVIYSNNNHKIYLNSILESINAEREISNVRYDATLMDLSEILISFIGLVTNFLFGLSIVLFLVAIISISNVVNISFLERKQEFIIFKTFGLRNSEISSLHIYEIVIIALISMIISLIASFVSVGLVCLLFDCKLSFSFIFMLIVSLLIFIMVLIFSSLSVKNTKNISINDI